MARRAKGKSHNLKRRAATRDVKKRILIVCEGEVTEPKYFAAFHRPVRKQPNAAIVEIDIDGLGYDPKSLVEHAKKKRGPKRAKGGFEGYDEVWCVFDVDDHKTLAAAVDQARAPENTSPALSRV